jgi:hypothetical protein
MNPRNAYYVLELPPEATPGEIERQGRKLLGLIELGTARGTAYPCPLGPQTRDATMVRDAMAALRDPARRAKERCLASLLVMGGAADRDSKALHEDLDDPVPEALRIVYPGL